MITNNENNNLTLTELISLVKLQEEWNYNGNDLKRMEGIAKLEHRTLDSSVATKRMNEFISNRVDIDNNLIYCSHPNEIFTSNLKLQNMLQIDIYFKLTKDVYQKFTYSYGINLFKGEKIITENNSSSSNIKYILLSNVEVSLLEKENILPKDPLRQLFNEIENKYDTSMLNNLEKDAELTLKMKNEKLHQFSAVCTYIRDYLNTRIQ